MGDMKNFESPATGCGCQGFHVLSFDYNWLLGNEYFVRATHIDGGIQSGVWSTDILYSVL